MTAELQDRAAEDAAMIRADISRALSTVNCPDVAHYTDPTWHALAAFDGPKLAVMDERVPDPQDPARTLPVRRVRVVDPDTGAVRLNASHAPMTTEQLIGQLWYDRAASVAARWYVWPRTLGY